MAINPVYFTVIVTCLMLCIITLLTLLGRHLWRKRVDAATLQAILISLDGISSTRQQVVSNTLRPIYPDNEQVLAEQAAALVQFEAELQRNVLHAFVGRRISDLAAIPGWTEAMVTPYHQLIRRLSNAGQSVAASATAADEQQLDALRMAIASDIRSLQSDVQQNTARLQDGLSEVRARLDALESNQQGGLPEAHQSGDAVEETATTPLPEDAASPELSADTGGSNVVFDNEQEDAPIPATDDSLATAESGDDSSPDQQAAVAASIDETPTTPEEDAEPSSETAAETEQPAAAVEVASENDAADEGLLIVEDDNDVMADDQDDLAAAWAEALDEAGSEAVDVDALLAEQDPTGNARQSA